MRVHAPSHEDSVPSFRCNLSLLMASRSPLHHEREKLSVSGVLLYSPSVWGIPLPSARETNTDMVVSKAHDHILRHSFGIRPRNAKSFHRSAVTLFLSITHLPNSIQLSEG